MTREEEIEKAVEEEFEDHLFEDESDYIMQSSKFKKGIKWSDEHPREGLVDIDKIASFIKYHAQEFVYISTYSGEAKINEFKLVEAMYKAMED